MRPVNFASAALALALSLSPAFAAQMAKPAGPAAGVHSAQPAPARQIPALGAPAVTAPAAPANTGHNCTVGQSAVPSC